MVCRTTDEYRAMAQAGCLKQLYEQAYLWVCGMRKGWVHRGLAWYGNEVLKFRGKITA